MPWKNAVRKYGQSKVCLKCKALILSKQPRTEWDIVKSMLESGYDPNVQLESRTALHYAAEYKEWRYNEFTENKDLSTYFSYDGNIEAADKLETHKYTSPLDRQIQKRLDLYWLV